MSSILATILQLALSLLTLSQGNPSVSVAQQQQAITVATEAIQIASQALQNTSAASSTVAAVGTINPIVGNNGDGSPVRLRIPKLNVDAGFQYTGLAADGSMEIPNNIFDVGWYTGSARPGEKGTAVITGHVAQIRRSVLTKQGVFYNLNELRAGDKLFVLNNRGESVTFVVREIRLYDPSADAADVFTSNDGGAHLNLITCEGTWDQSRLSYTQRLVVFTDATP